jgi:flagellin-like protein
LKKLKRNEKGVSPVIATILMVAMTVVLTAVLYLMVMGMTGGDVERTMWGSFTLTAKDDNTSFDLTFSRFQPNPPRPLNMAVLVEFEDSEGRYAFVSNSDGDLSLVEGTDLCDIYFEDYVNDGLISDGDLLRFTNCSPGGLHIVYVLDATTGNVVHEDSINLPGLG